MERTSYSGGLSIHTIVSKPLCSTKTSAPLLTHSLLVMNLRNEARKRKRAFDKLHLENANYYISLGKIAGLITPILRMSSYEMRSGGLVRPSLYSYAMEREVLPSLQCN